MIEVKSVRKIYGKKDSAFEALKDVSLTIKDGATVAIIGKSGSGKSTLMHIMGGLDTPTEGEVVVHGQSIGAMKRRQIDRFRAHDLGFVFQSFFVEANQTCYQNVALPLEINETTRSKRKQLIESALERVELLDKMETKAKHLSGGQKQRLAIARAIVNSPTFIFADEPTGNLDSTTGEKIIDLLFDLNKKLGSTLVVITHDHELASRCEMQIAIKDGRIVEIDEKKRSPKSVGKAKKGTK